MSQLIAVAYDDEFRAERVRSELLALEKAHLVDLEDAVVVVRTAKGRLRLNQLYDLTASGALSGAWWGLLIGIVLSLPFLGPGAIVLPFVGGALGAGLGALSGAASDLGIDDRFVSEVSSRLQNGTSALFVLVRQATPDRVLEAVRPFGGEVMVTSLSREAEGKLREALRPLREQFGGGEPAGSLP